MSARTHTLRICDCCGAQQDMGQEANDLPTNWNYFDTPGRRLELCQSCYAILVVVATNPKVRSVMATLEANKWDIHKAAANTEPPRTKRRGIRL